MEYHKIQTIFKRDQKGKILEGEFTKDAFHLLANNIVWQGEEKIDGTNIRVIWDGENVTFGGRTDRAQTPQFLLDRLTELFPKEKFKAAELPPMTLYGEGYGAKIQKGGGNYIPDGQSFILFDVFCGGLWLRRADVYGIGNQLEIDTAPMIFTGTLLQAVAKVRNGFDSCWDRDWETE